MSIIRQFKIPFLLTAVLIVLHFISKDFTNPYERPIGGDAQGYYAYLPAIFIYQDLDYSFAPEMNAKYYPDGFGKSFVKETPDGEKVNKTFPGVAVLYAPFFFLAHGTALIFGLDADGYSNVYQFFYLLGYWFYFLLGLIFFVKVLSQLGFSEKRVNLALVLLVLGTNIFFYSVQDQSVTHIHNFFMINAMLYYLLRFRDTDKYWQLGLSIFLLALIGITRPTNVLVIFLILFFIPHPNFYFGIFKTLKKPIGLLKTVLIGLSVILIPLLLWKAQTGKWIVYSYGEEGFDFANPHFVDFLISYLKGWWVYTPLALLILIPGWFVLFGKHKGRALYVLGFYLLSVYIFSSWWCWYYGAGMGQRVMIDHFILLGYLLVLVLDYLAEKKWLKRTFLLVALGCVSMNIVQAYQIRFGIIPMGAPTKEQYWDNFLSFEKRAKVYPPENWIKIQEIDLDLSPKATYLLKDYTRMEIDGEWTIHVSEHYEYSGVVKTISKFDPDPKLIVAFDARARTEVEETRLVVKATYGDQKKERSYRLGRYTHKDQWVPMEFLFEVPFGFTHFEMYFWNAGTKEKVEVKNIKLSHYFTDDYM